MSEEASHSQSIEVPSPGAHHGAESGGSIMDVSGSMVLLTWITFVMMTFVLYKVAWKPILKALDLREESIRKALADAEKARAETAELESRQQQLVKDAQLQAQKLIDDARQAARQTADTIQAKANQDTRELIENAKKEIASATDKARIELRRESAELAIAIATRVIGDNMDSARNRTLIQTLTKES